jgi:hypothetical protein
MNRALTAQDHIEMLREENRQLREHIARLTGRDHKQAARRLFNLTDAEACIVMMLVTCGQAEYGALQDSIYSDRVLERIMDPDWAIRSHMKRIRKKTQPHGVYFETVYSYGYRMTEENRARARKLLEAA